MEDILWHTHWVDEYGFEDNTKMARSKQAARTLADAIARNARVGDVWLESTNGTRENVPWPAKRI